MTDITLYGASASPFVRKVQFALAEKGLVWESVPTVPVREAPPGFPLPWITPALSGHTPLGKIPFIRIGEHWLCDSTVILACLERLHPEPALLPADPWACAEAMWIEEYIDGGAVPKLFNTIFFERRLAPMLMGRPTDEAVVDKAITHDLPVVYGYLDGKIGTRSFFAADAFTVADLGVASFFESMRQAGVAPEAARYPNLVRYLQRVNERPSIAAVLAREAAGGAPG